MISMIDVLSLVQCDQISIPSKSRQYACVHLMVMIIIMNGIGGDVGKDTMYKCRFGS